MRVRIVKFGGTSLLDAEAKAAALAWVKDLIRGGVLPVIVISAFGRRGDPYSTDTLIDLARSVCLETPSREIAMIASCGEIISTVSFTSWLLRSGISSRALTGAEAGIRTEAIHEGADILFVETSAVINLLQKRVVPVVTGFQGQSACGELTILHRGGSDTTATALGFALNAEAVDLFSDVPGLFTADPRNCIDAKVMPTVSFAQAVALALQGAKVIHSQAIGWALRGNFPIYIRQLSNKSSYTQIGPNEIDTKPVQDMNVRKNSDIGAFAP